jgi:hypothetical protein
VHPEWWTRPSFSLPPHHPLAEMLLTGLFLFALSSFAKSAGEFNIRSTYSESEPRVKMLVNQPLFALLVNASKDSPT